MPETSGQIIDRILYAAAAEMGQAVIRFPQPNYVALKVAEEAGEVVKAAVHYSEGRETWENVEKEVIQMIAMGLRLIVEGDQINGIHPKLKP
jgi:phosphoribosyl-ATP pyrophosphohydrolase